MATVTLTPTAASIRNPNRRRAYGMTVRLPIETGVGQSLFRVGIPTDIPPDAIVVAATLRLSQWGGLQGTTTVAVRPITASWSLGKVTWNTLPSSGPISAQVTKAGTTDTTLWEFDLTADFQARIAGLEANRGWRIYAIAGSARFRGTPYAKNSPELVLEYLTEAPVPDNLTPDGGAASVTHPTLSFSTGEDTLAIQVQTIGSDAVEWDSGEVPATEGLLDLAVTSFPGITVDVPLQWRARSKGPLGWGEWSDYAEVTYVPHETVEITSPGTVADDSTPPIAWTSTGVQVSWQVIVRNEAGNGVANSGRTVGENQIWTPPKATAKEGEQASVEVRVWDDVDRAASPGAPNYAAASLTYTLQAAAGIAGPDTVHAATDGLRPAVELTATRAAIPDGWAVVRDGVRIHRFDEPTATFEWTDWTAPPNTELHYRIAPIVNGKVSDQGEVEAVVVRCRGLWLIDPDTGRHAVLWGQESGEWSAEEIAATHQPLRGMPIRRVSYRPPMAGSISGDVIDVADIEATETIAALHAFKGSPAETRYRYVAGHLNLPVTIGNVLVKPTPLDGSERMATGSFDWAQVDEVAWEMG